MKHSIRALAALIAMSCAAHQQPPAVAPPVKAAAPLTRSADAPVDPAATLRPDEFDTPAGAAVPKKTPPPAHHHHGAGS